MMRASPESATLWLVLGKTVAPKPARTMTNASDTLPCDIDALWALIRAERAAHATIVAERNAISAERDKLATRNERLDKIPAKVRVIVDRRELMPSCGYPTARINASTSECACS
jgi:hypothetical protein